MPAIPGQAEQALHGGSTIGGEIDLHTPVEGLDIDWNSFDTATAEEFSNLAEPWKYPAMEMAVGMPEAGILPTPTRSITRMSDREPEAPWNNSEVFRTPSPTVPLPPGEGMKQLQRPLSPHITPTADMFPSTTQQLGANKVLVTCGNITQSLTAQYSMCQPDVNRKFIMPTEDLLPPARPLMPRPSYQPRQRYQPSNAQPPANVSAPAPPVERQQQRGPETSRHSKERTSNKAANDEAANVFEGRIAKLFPQNSLDAGARPIKRIKESHTSVPWSLAQKQAHQRQALQKQASLRALPPPPPPPQQKSARSPLQLFPPPRVQPSVKQNANRASLGSSSIQVVGPPGPLTSEADNGPDRKQLKELNRTQDPSMKDEAELVIDDDDVHGIPKRSDEPLAKKPKISGQGFQTQHAEHQRTPRGNMFTSAHSFPAHLGRYLPSQPQQYYQGYPALDQCGPPQPVHRQNYAPPQHHRYDPQQRYPSTQCSTHGYPPAGYPPQGPPQGYQPQRASDTPEARRQIHENYDRYVQQNRRRKTPESPKPRTRKRPAEIIGNDGKVIKRKQRMATKARGMVFGGRSQEKLLEEQQELFAEAELRADEERAARLMDAIEQEEAKLREEQNEKEERLGQPEATEEIAEQLGSQIARLKAKAEQEARKNREQNEQDEADDSAKEKRAAWERKLAKDEDRQKELSEDEDFLNTVESDEA